MLKFLSQMNLAVRSASRLVPKKVKRFMSIAANSRKAHFEVERKFTLSEAEYRSLPDVLTAKGFKFAGCATMTDTFVPTVIEGDMIRIRRQVMDDKPGTFLTQKTWTEVQGNREREEQEEEVTEFVADTLLEIGSRLAAKPLYTFSKDRDHYSKTMEDGRSVVVALDVVEGIGEYSGHYLEIEIQVPVGADVEPARLEIKRLVRELTGEDREFVQLSYMEMLKRSHS